MQKYLYLKKLNPLKRALASLNIVTRQRYQHFKNLRSIKQNDALHDHTRIAEYSDILSYTYKLFDCQKQRSIYQFVDYNDREIGGDSTSQLYFNKDQGCLTIQGYIDAKDKEKMAQYPSIGIARTHPYKIGCGPFNAIQVELNSDGQPIHIGVELISQIEGLVSCYGIITSKLKGWNSYELPLQNMLLVGAQTGPRGTYDYRTPTNSSTFFDRSAYDARRFLAINQRHQYPPVGYTLYTQEGEPQMYKCKAEDYHSQCAEAIVPFFFIVERDPYVLNSQMGVSWLTKGYKDIKKIDLGDKIYKRMSSQPFYHH